MYVIHILTERKKKLFEENAFPRRQTFRVLEFFWGEFSGQRGHVNDDARATGRTDSYLGPKIDRTVI
jgi:hypothetical protein